MGIGAFTPLQTDIARSSGHGEKQGQGGAILKVSGFTKFVQNKSTD